MDAKARAPVGCAKWRISVYGSYTFQGKSQMHLIEVDLTEFEGLSQAVILGVPYFDLIGGMEFDNDRVRLSGIYYPRAQPIPEIYPDPGVHSLVRVNHVPFTPMIDDQGWYQLDLVAHGIRTMDPTKEYWLEDAQHDRMHILEAPITFDLGSDPLDIPGSLGH